jgi:Spy/CpxP family protein refolding chaperone
MSPTRLVATIFFAAALSLAAVAQDAGAPALNPRAIHRIEHRLDITSQQREQARAILQQERPQLQQIRMSLAAEQEEMTIASANGSFDPATAHAVAMKYAEANASAAAERAKLRVELLAILTSEQKAKLQQMRARVAAALGSEAPGLGDTL